ncbi:heme transporter FLVCR2 isoform X2 [Anabrus simplex]
MTEPCQVYRRRWLMLALFVLTSSANASHWLQYSIITNIMMRFYGVSSLAINWTSMVYMAAYIPLVFPASWLLDRKGLRVTLLAGAAIMTAGSWVKVLSASPDRFAVAFLGQTLVGAAQMFILGVPARLAAVWFGPNQVSTACAIGVFGNQVGIALGFLLPPAFVGNHDDLDLIARDMSTMYYTMAGVPMVVFLLLLLFFEAEPPTPPSPAQARIPEREGNYFSSLRKLVSNRSFVLLLVSYGINVGVFYAVSTLLNQMVLQHFEDAEEDAGRIGLTMVLAGIVGSVCGGVVLDRTHRFKETTLVVYLMALVGMVGFTFTLNLGDISLLYITGAFLGFFMTGYLGVGYEFAAELTYPVPEGTSSGLLNASSEIFGVTLTLGAGEILDVYGDRVTNMSLTGILVLGVLLSILIKGTKLRRREACKTVSESQPFTETPTKYVG